MGLDPQNQTKKFLYWHRMVAPSIEISNHILRELNNIRDYFPRK